MSDVPVERLLAGDAFRATLVPKAEAKYLPELLWHGWAIMDGFLAGVDWQIQQHKALAAKVKTLVDLLDEREKYHGSLIGPETLALVNDLRLELAK